MIIRAYGRSTTETQVATLWKEFLGCYSPVSVSEKREPCQSIAVAFCQSYEHNVGLASNCLEERQPADS